MVFGFSDPTYTWRGIDTVLPRCVISRIVFQLDVKKPFFIVCENGRHVVSVWAQDTFTLRSKAVRVLISYNENICDTKTKSVRSALH